MQPMSRQGTLSRSDACAFNRALRAGGRVTSALKLEIFVQRTTEYRGFEIQVDVQATTAGMFDASFRIGGPIRPPGVMALGERIEMRGGPFSRVAPRFRDRRPGRCGRDSCKLAPRSAVIRLSQQSLGGKRTIVR
jgi:hypothetical protein